MFEKMVQCDKVRDAMATKSIGETVQAVLKIAQRTQRTTLGFSESIKLLSTKPEEVQFCFLVEPKRGDSATHMSEVLLQAFCVEHGIYIIKIDSGRKLAHILGTLNTDENCVLIRKPSSCSTNGSGSSERDSTTASYEPTNDSVKSANFSAEEDVLASFCEAYWDNDDYCIVSLPEL